VKRQADEVFVEKVPVERRREISEFELRQLEDPRNDLDQEFKQRTSASVSVASRHRIYSKDRT
jgi:hypothetical protein